MSSKLSRRALVQGVATTTTIPIVSVLSAKADPALDAKLADLGRQFEALYEQWLPSRLVANRLFKQTHAAAQAAVGFEDWRNDRFIDAVDRIGKETGFNEIEERADELALEMERLQRSIVQLPATTVEGLRAYVWVMLYASYHAWGYSFEHLDYPEAMTRRLIEALAPLVGISVPMERTTEGTAQERPMGLPA
jgi:hypothetical protein